MDLGPCPKFHTDEFKSSLQSNFNDYEYYENLLEKELLSYLADVDKKIKVSFMMIIMIILLFSLFNYCFRNQESV